MPEGYRKERPYPGKTYRLAEAAEHNLLILARCSQCRRMVRFLASDLVELLGPKADATEAPFPCSKCGTKQFVRVSFHQPDGGDYGHLWVRRPGPVKTIQTWVTVRLGD